MNYLKLPLHWFYFYYSLLLNNYEKIGDYITSIITHPGSAHIDDFLSVCLVIARFKNISVVFRKDPSEEELNNSEIWKLDIGNNLDSKLKMFDHHQYGVEDCTLSLLLKDWDLWERAIEVFPQLPTMVIMDSRGPKEVAKSLDISSKAVNILTSILEREFLRFFSKKKEIKNNSGLFKVMEFIGSSFFEYIEEFFALYHKISDSIEFEEIKGVPVIFCLVEGIESSDSLFQVITKIKNERNYAIRGGILVFPNDRPPGSIGLRRLRDDKRVDFNRITKSRGFENTLFVHKRGFMAAVSELSDYELKEYIKASII